MCRTRTRRFVLATLLLLGLTTPAVSLTSCSDDTAGSDCGSCGSGDVRWDGGVDRCRDNANGQFVKNCCCGY